MIAWQLNTNQLYLSREGVSFIWPEEPGEIFPCRFNIWLSKKDKHCVVARSFFQHTRTWTLKQTCKSNKSSYKRDSRMLT